MEKHTALLLSGIGIGIGVVMLRNFVTRKSRHHAPQVEKARSETPQTSSQVNRGEQPTEHLVELNTATADELKQLGLDGEFVDRLIENRPYRSKLDLVSRIVLPESVYVDIREKVTVAAGDEPIKVAM